MRSTYLGDPPQDPEKFRMWAIQAFESLKNSTYEDADIATVAQDFTVSSYTELRTLTGAASLADLANAFCTFIDDIKSRGMKR